MDIQSPGLTDHALKNIEITARRLIGKCGITRADLGDLVSELTLDLLRHLPLHDERRSGLSTYVQVVVTGKARRILRDRCRGKRTCLRDADSLDAPNGRDEDGDEVCLADMLDADETAIALGHRGRSRRDEDILRLDVTAVLSRLPLDLQQCCAGLMDGRSVSELARESGLSRGAFRARVLAPIRRAFRAAGYGDVRTGGAKTRRGSANRATRGEEDQWSPGAPPATPTTGESAP